MVEVSQTECFVRWFDGLRDLRGRAKVLARIERLIIGNPGDVKPVGADVSELRINYGPGYRVYYVQDHVEKHGRTPLGRWLAGLFKTREESEDANTPSQPIAGKPGSDRTATFAQINEMQTTSLQALVASGGPAPDDYSLLNKMLDQLSTLPPAELDAAVQNIRTILAPTLTQDTMQGFALLKPHGYPGDFEIIDRIYQGWTSPCDHLERWDHYFNQRAAPTAVRNRNDYFIHLVQQFDTKPSHILNVASGPGRDLLECLEQTEAEHFFTCIDVDPTALDYSRALCARFADRIKFHQSNALRFRSSEKFDLVWSGGLFDYFTDRVFVATLTRLLRLLAAGGECVIGNFSTTNPSRAYMLLVGDWNLVHRTPEELKALALLAGAQPNLTEVREEPLGVNLFLHIRKE